MTKPSLMDSSAKALDLTMLPEERWPQFFEHEIDAVAAVLQSGKVNQWTGSKVFAFQDAYDAYLGHGRKSIALANGSVALELALRAFGIGPGDEVIVTPRTFAASAFCVMLVGATPVFADVDMQSGNITPSTVEAVITPKTKAIIPVHLGGWPVDIKGMNELAAKHEIKVIEDCAQAHGASIDGVNVGALSDAAAFSFCQDKIMTTGGEGGLTVFKDPELFEWAWSFKDHGKNRARVFAPKKQPGFQWLLDMYGTNWRMLETSAAIGIEQLERLDQTRKMRTERAMLFFDALNGIDGLRIPTVPNGYVHAYYKPYVYIDRGIETEVVRDRILSRLSEVGIPGLSGSCSEIYREKAFAHLEVERLPNAKALGEASIQLLVHPTLDLARTHKRANVMAEIISEELA